MSTDTPSESITALLAYSQADEEGIIVTVSRQAIHEVVRENARLREEVEMLNVRHAAAMLHAQTHADEYNALREDEKGLLQDIQRLTEEAFKRDEELAEAKRKSVGVERDNNNLAKDLLGVRQLYSSAQQMLLEAEDRSIQHFGAAIQEKTKREQAEARALANEKDAWRYRFLRSESTTSAQIQVMNDETQPPYFTLKSGEELDAAIDAAIAGAKHD